MMPPLWIVIGMRGWNLWLPLFLLWLLLLVLLSPIVVLALAAALVLAFFPSGREWLRLAGQVWRIFCSLRGLEIDVDDARHAVRIYLL